MMRRFAEVLRKMGSMLDNKRRYCFFGVFIFYSISFGVILSEVTAKCIPSFEICDNGIDEGCSGLDSLCKKCEGDSISEAGCICGPTVQHSGYCCRDVWQANPCGGRMFYLGNNGSDSNDGSEFKPWKTLAHASKNLKAGDVLLINPGNYLIKKQISLRTSGEKYRPIIIRGNGEEVILDFSNCANRNAFEIHFANYIKIENLTIRASKSKYSRGVRLTHSKGSVIHNNKISGAHHANIFCSMSDQILIRNNEVFEGQIGIYVADSTDYPIVIENLIHNNSAIGLHMNGDKRSGGDGIISYAIVENNILYDNGMGINVDGVTQSVFRNNILYDNRTKGIAFFKGDGAVPSEDNLLNHNTIIMPAGASYAVGLNYGAYKNMIYNNIIVTEGNVPCFSTTASSSELEIVSDHNILADLKNVAEIGDSWISLKKWQRLGYDKHSFQVALPALFMDLDNKVLSLQPESPAIDAGTDLHSYGKDQAGNVRPCGKEPDIGALELCPKKYKISPHINTSQLSSKQEKNQSLKNRRKDDFPRQHLDNFSKDALRKRFTNQLGMEFAFVSPGSFIMGLPKDRSDSMRQHRVSLTNGFYAQITEVTQKQWKEVMGENPSFFKDCGPGCPVEQVSWNGAQKFIRALNRIENTDKYRLPTEAEWEYMARAGTKMPSSFGRCLSAEEANYDGNFPFDGCPKQPYMKKPVPAESFLPNPWGLKGLYGNVWEWCSDWLGDYPASAVTDPKGPTKGILRVIRGGGWNSYAKACRSGNRSGIDPGKGFVNLGFRVVRQP